MRDVTQPVRQVFDLDDTAVLVCSVARTMEPSGDLGTHQDVFELAPKPRLILLRNKRDARQQLTGQLGLGRQAINWPGRLACVRLSGYPVPVEQAGRIREPGEWSSSCAVGEKPLLSGSVKLRFMSHV